MGCREDWRGEMEVEGVEEEGREKRKLYSYV